MSESAPHEKFFAKSLSLWGAAVVAVTAALPGLNASLEFFSGGGISIDPSWIAGLDDNVKMIITGAGGVVGVAMIVIGRVKAWKAPVISWWPKT